MTGARISSISPGSPAALVNIAVGDKLISINGKEPTDIIEYQQLIDGEIVQLVLQRDEAPLRHRVTIKKDVGQPLGMTIDSAVFDRIRTCDNHCTFCFIYQLPKGMRRSLYVKDDDFRLSFLYGNYTTLTRFTEFDLERVIEENLSPLYVSIHTTNPSLRASMLRNPRGATSLRWLRELLKAEIEVHAQIVVCPGVNDGVELERTLSDVVTFYPELRSVAVVPIGISTFSGETDMRGHTPAEARAVIALTERYHQLTASLWGKPCVFASDEFYLVAGLPTPAAEHYASLDQAENGIGLVAAFVQSFAGAQDMDKLGTGFFQSVDGAPPWGYRATRFTESALDIDMGSNVVIATGEYAAPILREILASYGYDVEILAVPNNFFGGNIKVAGLITGADLIAAVSNLESDTLVLVPDVCLSEDRFLDDLTLEDIPRRVQVVRTTGQNLRRVLDAHFHNRLVSQ